MSDSPFTLRRYTPSRTLLSTLSAWLAPSIRSPNISISRSCPVFTGPVIIKTVNAVNANGASIANKSVNANKVISVNSTAMATMIDKLYI
ncbi:uncharacterized protein B0T23DRAFT_429616 [Neurospora hispaniola]|uniref:Uncharacterized protein n=1 Tax=Neurospora hispaniola TaxID=588809 RepID=A0AAJ0I5B0_9PEZI|nr:hypothetical protein B0T23DRAFT_429616 [Neurospora hispaniola]